jgi:methyl-accepting chemotaxis protein
VASEVKTLANRTAKATEEITGIQISAAVEEQSASTPKIARSLQ